MSPRRGMEQPDRPAAQHLREQMLAGLPIADRRMSLARVPTAVLEGGEGPPIVLLHSSGEFAALWIRVVPDLVTTHRVIAPDLPGHGASAAAADGGFDLTSTLAWVDGGRHDLQVPVRIAEAARARYGWPLHVIDEAGDDPAMERPEAFIEALRAGLTPLTRAEAGS